MEKTARPKISSNEHYFLQGGGEMGKLIRSKDWSKTPLGDPATWPQSLCTMVSVMMNNPFGMYIAWGKEYTQIYNDSYRPILGATKHPAALGIGTRETFAEVWHIIESMFEGVMNGQAVGFPDFMLPLNRDGFAENCYFDFSYSPIKKENGEVGGVLVTVIETTNKKRVEEELKESKDQLQFAIESTELATWDYNPANDKFTSNFRLKEWFGLKDEHEIDLQVAINSIAENDQQRVANEVQHSMQYDSGGKYDIEFTIINPLTNQHRIVRAKGRAWFDDSKVCYRLNGTIQDISEQATARINLEKKAEQLRIALEGGELGTFDYFPLEDKLLWSAKTKELFGLPPDDEANYDVYMQALHPDDRNASQAITQQNELLRNGGLYDLEYRTIGLTDGKVRWVRSKGIATFDLNNNPVRYTGVVQEITKYKEAEEALKESEGRFRTLANDIAAFIFTGDADINLEFVNRQWLEFVGFNSEEGIGKAWTTVTHPDDLVEISEVYADAVSKLKSYELEIRQRNSSGGYSWVLWKGTPRITSEGKFGGMIGVGIDITDRIIAQKELHSQQAETEKLKRLYEAVTGNTPDLIYIFDLQYRFTYANPALLAMWGKTWDEAIGKSLAENGYEPWHVEMHQKEIDQVIATKKPIRGTVSFPHAKLGKRTYDYIFAAVLNCDGNVEAVAGTTRDITELMDAEEKLLKSEQQMRAMVETAPFPIGVYIGKELKVEIANQSILDIWGKGNDVIGKPYKQILPVLDNLEIFKQIDSVYSTGIAYHTKNQKVEIVTDNETKSFYFNYSFTPLTDPDGKVYGVLNTAADVTDLNLAKLLIQNSEESLRSTILQAPVAMCILKGDNFIVELANDRMFELWGKPAIEIMHKPIFEGLSEAKDQGFEAILNGVYTTGKTFSADGVPATLPRNGGIEQVYINFVYEPYRSADGIVSGILAVAVDVTAQLTASKDIEEREQKFRLLADSMPQLIWTGDTDGNLNYFNQSVYDFAGLKEEEVIKEGGWLEIVHPEEREENIRLWLNSVRSGADFKFEHRFRRYDGEYRWQLSRAVPQKDAEGNIQMWVGTSTDIQEMKEHDQQKDDFISIASHEMKTPLTTAKGYLELLQMLLAKDNQTAFLYVNKANQAVKRLHGLVAELLDASKIQNGQLHYNISTFDFNTMIDETIENMQHTTEYHRIQKSGNVFHQITGDKDRLQQVLINLLSNAIKYSPKADKVLIKVKEQSGIIQVSIQDFGIGMSGQHVDKIFNRYYRVKEHAIHFQGLGIGLYLSSNIIQRHAGKMWADSESGKGSTFYFTIPLYSE